MSAGQSSRKLVTVLSSRMTVYFPHVYLSTCRQRCHVIEYSLLYL